MHIGKDRLEIDGQPIGQSQKIYLMMNKPRGVVTTASDERGRETIYAYLDKSTTGDLPWVAPVGRLDKASEGLLLLTNDSEWAARITAPSTHVDKTYHVQLAGAIDGHSIAKSGTGIRREGRRIFAGKERAASAAGRAQFLGGDYSG